MNKEKIIHHAKLLGKSALTTIAGVSIVAAGVSIGMMITPIKWTTYISDNGLKEITQAIVDAHRIIGK